MATEGWVNVGSGSGMLPNGTKSLSQPTRAITSNNVDLSVRSNDNHLRVIFQKMPLPLIITLAWKLLS